MVSCVIDCDVIARLEETHLANLFSADARGGDIGDGARGKLQARVRGIHAVSQDRDSDGMQAGDLDFFADQPLHDVQIVNHQVEHDVDVQGTRGELAYAMYLEIDRVANMRAQSHQCRVESL